MHTLDCSDTSYVFIGVFVALRMLYGSLNKVKEENPLLFKKFTCVCRKMKFPEVIRPGE